MSDERCKRYLDFFIRRKKFHSFIKRIKDGSRFGVYRVLLVLFLGFLLGKSAYFRDHVFFFSRNFKFNTFDSARRSKGKSIERK